MAKSPDWTQEDMKILKKVYPKLGRSPKLEILTDFKELYGKSL